jgi:hypothetical protein
MDIPLEIVASRLAMEWEALMQALWTGLTVGVIFAILAVAIGGLSWHRAAPIDRDASGVARPAGMWRYCSRSGARRAFGRPCGWSSAAPSSRGRRSRVTARAGTGNAVRSRPPSDSPRNVPPTFADESGFPREDAFRGSANVPTLGLRQAQLRSFGLASARIASKSRTAPASELPDK